MVMSAGGQCFEMKLCAIAIDEAQVVRQWGVSNDKKMAFRESYSKFYELRSLAPQVPFLTATATQLTKSTIITLLHMDNVHEIKESTNKLNIAYSVQRIDKDVELQCHFDWLTDELKQNKEKKNREQLYIVKL
ncbi:ATP-dependent DNA helicase hus2/rqh1 [Exaiptasia diaphana]|nr:ATP-dependent DNA helicase hus2/rqh1 [Exaiptasia diaphana]